MTNRRRTLPQWWADSILSDVAIVLAAIFFFVWIVIAGLFPSYVPGATAL